MLVLWLTQKWKSSQSLASVLTLAITLHSIAVKRDTCDILRFDWTTVAPRVVTELLTTERSLLWYYFEKQRICNTLFRTIIIMQFNCVMRAMVHAYLLSMYSLHSGACSQCCVHYAHPHRLRYSMRCSLTLYLAMLCPQMQCKCQNYVQYFT